MFLASRFLTVALVSSAVASAASAATIVSLVPAANPNPTGIPTGYAAYKAVLTSTTGIGAVDFATGGFGITGVSGTRFAQRWDYNADTEDYAQTVASTATTAAVLRDSHFLFSPSYTGAASDGFKSVSTIGDNEANDFVNLSSQQADTGSPTLAVNGSDYGTGTLLETSAGVALAYQSPTLTLAYLVIPSTGSVRFFGEIGAVGGAVESFDQTVAVPEPTSIAALAGVALLGLRRRRA